MSLLKTSVEDRYTKSPLMKYAYFPNDGKDPEGKKEKDTCSFALLYEENLQSSGPWGSKSDSIERLLAEVRNELGLSHLDWYCSIGRYAMTILKTDLVKAYEIINKITSKGHRVFIQDATQSTFSPGEEASAVKSQEKMLNSINEMISMGLLKDKSDLERWYGLPVHKDDFWLINDGKEFARIVRQRFNLEDKINPNDMFIGEALVYAEEKNASLKKEEKIDDGDDNNNNNKKAKIDGVIKVDDIPDDEIDPCMVCLDKPPNTMVLPCEHCVVCKDCSIALKSTINNKKCIKCRTEITAVLD